MCGAAAAVQEVAARHSTGGAQAAAGVFLGNGIHVRLPPLPQVCPPSPFPHVSPADVVIVRRTVRDSTRQKVEEAEMERKMAEKVWAALLCSGRPRIQLRATGC